jgi:hypothetical protein
VCAQQRHRRARAQAVRSSGRRLAPQHRAVVRVPPSTAAPSSQAATEPGARTSSARRLVVRPAGPCLRRVGHPDHPGRQLRPLYGCTTITPWPPASRSPTPRPARYLSG